MSSSLREPTAWEELVADEALIGLSDEERRELAALEHPDFLARETALFERAAGEIAAAAFAHADPEPMPAALAAKLHARLGAPRAPVITLPRRSVSRYLPWALAAAALVLAVVGWNRTTPKPQATTEAPTAASERARLLGLPGTARIDFAATKDAAAQQASGDVVWHSGLQRGFMRIAGLAPNDPKQTQYQLWVFDAERGDTYPVDGGVFDVTTTGEVLVPINSKLTVGKAKLFAITVEKPGGVVVSKRERIVLTATPS